jgi:prefoldin subunit 5
MSSSDEIQNQLSEYARFVEEVLKPQLEEAKSLANEVRTEIADYEDLGQRLESLMMPASKPSSGDGTNEIQKQQQHLKQKGMTSMVDLGYKTVFCNAVVRDTTMIFVNVGMGFHVQMPIEDARDFASKRISFLRTSKLKARESKEAEIMDHIQSASIILNQLQMELRRSSR